MVIRVRGDSRPVRLCGFNLNDRQQWQGWTPDLVTGAPGRHQARSSTLVPGAPVWWHRPAEARPIGLASHPVLSARVVLAVSLDATWLRLPQH